MGTRDIRAPDNRDSSAAGAKGRLAKEMKKNNSCEEQDSILCTAYVQLPFLRVQCSMVAFNVAFFAMVWDLEKAVFGLERARGHGLSHDCNDDN